ncbi:MAG: hypothetical protein KJ065_01205 [Anaerolineae bacterium]|nr:hypothetical protein [Anaerolineae bacterium]
MSQTMLGRVLPVIVSILIIIGVAILRNQSRLLAAILATMPINIPLALWVLSTGDDFKQNDFLPVTQQMLVAIVPSLFFVVILYFTARSGWSLVPMLVASYLGWGIILLLGFWLGFFAR